jgi:hypothetical protein
MASTSRDPAVSPLGHLNARICMWCARRDDARGDVPHGAWGPSPRSRRNAASRQPRGNAHSARLEWQQSMTMSAPKPLLDDLVPDATMVSLNRRHYRGRGYLSSKRSSTNGTVVSNTAPRAARLRRK